MKIKIQHRFTKGDIVPDYLEPINKNSAVYELEINETTMEVFNNNNLVGDCRHLDNQSNVFGINFFTNEKLKGMKKLDEYGKGRESVIKEMLEWAKTEIDKIKALEPSDNGYFQATLSGQVKAYSKAVQKLQSKLSNLKEKV